MNYFYKRSKECNASFLLLFGDVWSAVRKLVFLMKSGYTSHLLEECFHCSTFVGKDHAISSDILLCLDE